MASNPAPQDVDWTSVAQAIPRRREEETASWGVLAGAESLSALYSDDFATALARVISARRTEPLNPVHTLRLGLVLLRFGETEPALAVFQALEQSLPGHPLPTYLRALATLQQEEPRRAANIAGELVSSKLSYFPAKFLQAEAQLRYQTKGLKKILSGLPKGPAHATSWANLIVQMALSGNPEAQALAREFAENAALLPKGGKEYAVAARAVALGSADLPTLETALMAVPAGSRAEELILLLIQDRLVADGSLAEAVEAVRKIHDRLLSRGAVRRLLVALLTRLAMERAGQEQYAEALRLVERSLLLEPHQTVHYQNRAALFTLMRETEAYHDAWFELNRHYYRLALLGKIDPEQASSVAKPHRLFAQQARMPVEPRGGRRLNPGFLIESRRKRDEGDDWIVSVNQERIDADPDLLRQWIHHRRAELVFSHRALGADPRRFLLYPDDVRISEARAKALIETTGSLAVLVPDEGRILGERFAGFWGRYRRQVDASYALPPEDLAVAKLREAHLETLADLALLCLTWKPSGLQSTLAEEVLAFLHSEGPFFDEMVLFEALRPKQGEVGYPLKILSGFIDDELDLDSSKFNPLNPRQRAKVIDRLGAELLTRLAFSSYEALRGTTDAAQRALGFVERARKLDPGNARKDILAARFLLLSGFDDDARAVLTDLQRTARSRDPEIYSEIEELRKVLDDRAKRISGRVRKIETLDEVAASLVSDRVGSSDLEREVEQFPSSILAYEDLARRLAGEGRFAEAIEWTERAIAQCLGRDGQVRARSLSMEILGLKQLSMRNQDAVRLCITGAHRPALEIIESIPEGQPVDYTLLYLLGTCRLALGRPEDARRSFELALNQCSRQLHRTVLRSLASDVDRAYLLVARRAIDDLIEAGSYENAIREALAMAGRLRQPDSGLYDLARVLVEAASAQIGTDHAPLPMPGSHELAVFDPAVAEAFAETGDLERAIRLATLSSERDEASRRQADLVVRKAKALAEQEAIAQVLARSSAFLKLGQHAEALKALDKAKADEPRVIRQRALLLLKLERFAEAEAEAAKLAGMTGSVAREFSSTFPTLSLRQRISTSSRMLREGSADEALEILKLAVPRTPEESVELAYCRGFGLTMRFHRLRRDGKTLEARETLDEAMSGVEPQVAAARTLGHARLIELYEALDTELSRA